jgi:hypothetical protein
MQIRLHVEGAPLAATLDDAAVARDFATLPPLALTLADYAATEKVADLPRPLSTAGAPAGTAASAGDIMHYAPWGNLAVFYRHAGAAHFAGDALRAPAEPVEAQDDDDIVGRSHGLPVRAGAERRWRNGER